MVFITCGVNLLLHLGVLSVYVMFYIWCCNRRCLDIEREEFHPFFLLVIHVHSNGQCVVLCNVKTTSYELT